MTSRPFHGPRVVLRTDGLVGLTLAHPFVALESLSLAMGRFMFVSDKYFFIFTDLLNQLIGGWVSQGKCIDIIHVRV